MLLHPDALAVLALALLIDAVVGDPDAIWRRWPHPVAWFGWLIARLDSLMNRERDGFLRRRLLGIVALALAVAPFAAGAWTLHAMFRAVPAGWLAEALVASILIAQRSLHDHVARVAAGLDREGLDGGRAAVAMIVGREPQSLDGSGVARAAIESTAENFSDGVVAPALWYALLGLPGLAAYKVVNTADSMIGHLSERHRAFGWAAARLDDLVNLPASRLSGVLIALAAPLAGGSVGRALSTMVSQAPLHRSPNAGWPEAAMAGALGLALAGPRRYRERVVDDPFLNPGGRRDASAQDIRRGLRLLSGAAVLHLALVAGLAAALR
jgi:adenosylcobinamide-phosphate synthase